METSPEFAGTRRELQELETRRPKVSVVHPDRKDVLASTYAAPFSRQFLVVSHRVFQQYWRTPSYIYSKLILSGGTVRWDPPPLFLSTISEVLAQRRRRAC